MTATPLTRADVENLECDAPGYATRLVALLDERDLILADRNGLAQMESAIRRERDEARAEVGRLRASPMYAVSFDGSTLRERCALAIVTALLTNRWCDSDPKRLAAPAQAVKLADLMVAALARATP